MAEDYVLMADIEVDAVRSGAQEFTLEGRGADDADYRLEMRMEMPLDARTRTVLGELLAQTDVRLLRRVRTPLKPRRAARTRQV